MKTLFHRRKTFHGGVRRIIWIFGVTKFARALADAALSGGSVARAVGIRLDVEHDIVWMGRVRQVLDTPRAGPWLSWPG
jgi:hypothetical protein